MPVKSVESVHLYINKYNKKEESRFTQLSLLLSFVSQYLELFRTGDSPVLVDTYRLELQ